jgi:hypothetical protein
MYFMKRVDEEGVFRWTDFCAGRDGRWDLRDKFSSVSDEISRLFLAELSLKEMIFYFIFRSFGFKFFNLFSFIDSM